MPILMLWNSYISMYSNVYRFLQTNLNFQTKFEFQKFPGLLQGFENSRFFLKTPAILSRECTGWMQWSFWLFKKKMSFQINYYIKKNHNCLFLHLFKLETSLLKTKLYEMYAFSNMSSFGWSLLKHFETIFLRVFSFLQTWFISWIIEKADN